MNNDNGRIWFSIGIDNEQLKKDAEKSKEILRNIGKGIDVKPLGAYESAMKALVGSIEDNQKVLNRVQSELKQIAEAKKAAGKSAKDMTEREKELKESVRDLTSLIKLQQRELSAEAGSVDQLRAKLSLLNKAFNSMSAEQHKLPMGQVIIREVKQTTEALRTMEGELGKNTSKVQEHQGGVTKALQGTWSFMKYISYLIPSLGIAGLFDLAIEGLKALWEEFRKNNGALNEFKRRIEITAEALKDSGYLNAKAEVASLKEELRLATEGKISAKKAIDHYNDSLGKATGGVASLGEMERKLASSAEGYLRMLQLKTKATIAYRKAAEEGVLADIEMNEYGQFGPAFMRFLKTPSEWFKSPVPSKITNPFQVQIDYADSKRKSEGLLNKLGDDYQQQAAEVANKFKLNFFNDTDIKDGSSIANRVYQDTQQLKELLDEIAASKGKYQIEFGPKLESEQLKINQYFDSLAAKVDEFNKDPKRKVKLTPEQIGTAKSGIETGRQYALGLADDKERGNLLIEQLEEQKKLYKEYEDFKLNYGEEAANELYGNLTAKYKTYLDRVQAEYNKLEKKGAFGLNPSEATVFSQLTDLLTQANREAEQLRLDGVKKGIEAEEKSYNELIKKAKDYYLQIAKLEKDRQYAISALNRKNLSKVEYDQQLSAIEKYYSDAKKIIEVEGTDLFDVLNANMEYATSQSIEQAIKILDQALTSGQMRSKTGELLDIPPQVLANIRQYRDQLQGVLNDTSKLGKTAKTLAEIGNSLSQIGSSISTVDGGGGFGDMVQTIGASIVDLSNIVAKFQTAMGEIKKIFSSNSGKGSFDASSIISIIISAITFIVRLFGNVKRYKDIYDQMVASVESANAAMITGEYQLNAQLREQNLLKAESLSLTLEELEARKKVLQVNQAETKSESDRLLKLLQAEQYVTSRGVKDRTWVAQVFGGKPKEQVNYSSLAGMDYSQINKLFTEGRLEGRALALFQQLQKLKEEGVDIERQLLELQNEANGILTATTAGSITDSIVEGFRNGKSTIADFADSFEGMMREAMINSLKYKYLEGPIQDFYKQFAADAESGSGLTDLEIETLRSYYNNIISNANTQFERLKNITGANIWDSLGISESIRQSSSKGFASMSQDSANELNGRFTTIQGHTFQMNESLKLMSPLTEHVASIRNQMDFLRSNSAAVLVHLANIDTNTARLQSIEGDMKSMRSGIQAVKSGIDDINLKGIKLKT